MEPPAREPTAPPSTGVPPNDDERFRVLVESVQDYAIFLLDAEGRVASWNVGAERIKGWRADEIIGRPFTTFYPAEALAAGWPQLELQRAQAVGRFEDEAWRLRKDGSRFWANVVITALRDDAGVLLGYAKVTRDLTQRRRNEEALRQSEEQLRLLVGAVRDYAIFMLDPAGHVRSWNAGASAIKGYAAEEVLGRHFSMFFTAEDVAGGQPQRQLEGALRDGRAHDEGWRVRRDGSVFWAEVVLTPMFDSHGELRGYAKVTRDMSERRRLVELEVSSRRMNEFLAMLAHELRNPLAPLRNAASVLQMQPDLPPALRRMGDIVDRQLGHLTRLVDDLLDAGRIVSGKIGLHLAPLDLRDVVTASVEAVRPAIESRGQVLAVTLPGAPVPMTGDATRLVQALQNLLNNAERYTPAQGHIAVALRTDAGAATISVRDDGCGIAPEAIDRIFELFAQEPARSPTDSGLGIGLALARRLAELHGGMLVAASAGLGQGSTFTLRLPLDRTEEAAVPAHAAPAAAAPSGRRVLVVDDNRDCADTMVAVLQLLGCETRASYGGEQALRVAAQWPPSVVLLDLNMPGEDGYAVLRRLRALPGGPTLHVAAMTGYGRPADREATHAAGFQAHLTKPVDVAQLQALIAELGAGTQDARTTVTVHGPSATTREDTLPR